MGTQGVPSWVGVRQDSRGRWSGPDKEKESWKVIIIKTLLFLIDGFQVAGHLLRASWHYFIQASHQ